MKLKSLTPLLLFTCLTAILAFSLEKADRTIPSALIGQKVPAQLSPQLLSEQYFSSTQLLGKPWVLHVWASWCQSCRQEHQQLLHLASYPNMEIIGLNYKDTTEAAEDWLDEQGNPYSKIIEDTDGAQGIDWGIYAVPEIFLIDKEGIIRHKHTGPIDQAIIENSILPFFKLNRV